MADDLLPLLEAYTSAALTAMASFHGLAKKGARPKSETVRLLAGALTNANRLRTVTRELTPPERAVIEALQRGGGRLSVRALRETLKQQALLDDRSMPQPYGRQPPDPNVKQPRRIEDILARLCLRGLIFAADEPSTGAGLPAGQTLLRDFHRPVTSVVIPASIRRLLPAPPPQAAAAPPPPAIVSVSESSARALQRDLYLYWSFVQRQPLALTAKGEPRKAQLKEVNATLLVHGELGKGEGELDHPRLRFVRLLLGALKLLRPAPGGDTVQINADAADFFALPAAQRVQRCFAAWRAGEFWSELALLPPGVRPRSTVTVQSADRSLVKARELVLEYAAGLSQDQDWVPFNRLISQIRAGDYEFLIPRRAASAYDYSPYYGAHPYSSYGNRFGLQFDNVRNEEEGWDKVEANFIRGVLTGPMHWLGLLDLGWTGKLDPAAPEAFRLTPLGRWLLKLGPQPEIPTEGGRVIVQPNLHIVALDPVVDATLLTLDLFAERLSAERAVEYRLTRASVYAGQQRRWDVPRIKEFLRQQTGAELPGNVARTLDEWQAQHERIRLYPQVTLAHGLPAALDALAQHAQAPRLVAARLAPHLLRLTGPGAVPGVVQALGEHGVLPVVTRAGSLPPDSVAASEAGELTFVARQPSLYLHGHLAAFADPAGENGYLITAATVTRAVRAGLTAPQIVERLQTVHQGPVPAALARRIHAWAKHYGAAALEVVTLLQLRDAATLKELLADPDLAPLLQPFRPSPNKALARLKPADLKKLRALLAERGIDLDDKLA